MNIQLCCDVLFDYFTIQPHYPLFNTKTNDISFLWCIHLHVNLVWLLVDIFALSSHCKPRFFSDTPHIVNSVTLSYNARAPYYPSKRWMIFGCNYAASQFVRLHHFKWLAFTTMVIEFAIFPHLSQINKVRFLTVGKRKS